MNEYNNPFSPGAGTPPPQLAGRQELLHQAEILFGRIKRGRSAKSMLLTGLRGVGKTVLLSEFERMAEKEGYKTILVEAHEDKPIGLLLSSPLRSVLFELNRLAGASDQVKRGLRVLRSFVGSLRMSVDGVEISLDIDPEEGIADSGDLEADLPSLFVAIGEAAQQKNAAVALLVDEVQYFNKKELSALIMAMHKIQQRQLPLVLLGAGLPILPGLAGESKSYAERLFDFPDVGPLSEQESFRAIEEPVKEEGAEIQNEALSEVFRLTCGYPYFLQEWGYQIWNHAEVSPISYGDVQAASKIVGKRLDDNFFRVRFDRLTPKEKDFLRAMADLGNDEFKIKDVAERLGKTVGAIGPVRSSLIKKGMIYSPEYGAIAFTVPLFGDFMRRIIPDFEQVLESDDSE
jgi:hypothetical protein